MSKLTARYWRIRFNIKTTRQKKYREISATSENSEIWQSMVVEIGKMLPRVIYFPNFLFDFPEKILVSSHEDEDGDDTYFSEKNERRTNEYFKNVIADALAAMDPPLDLEKHVVERITAAKPDLNFGAFVQWFWGSNEKESLDTALEKLSRKVSEEIFGRWKEVLGKDLSDNEIEIKDSIEADEANNSKHVFLTFKVKQGLSRYKISERSLGFRWFFSFLLFTRFFDGRSDRSAIFLFDEPASNLHSKAQAKLLDSLGAIADGKNQIVYSTHSHHLINPLWLENAFIVSNSANLDEFSEGISESDDAETNITVEKYRTFVGRSAEKSHYFQPILDRLDYMPSSLEAVRQGVLVEGKSDFYILSWFKKYHRSESPLDIVPVNGVTNASAILGLYLGWAKSFVMLFDSDKEGKRAKLNYIEKLPLREIHAIEYDDIFPETNSKLKEIEHLISSSDKQKITAMHGASKISKQQILRSFSSALYGEEVIELSDGTMENLTSVFVALEERLEKQN